VLEKLDEIAAEHADLERQLADPAIHADQAKARELGKRYAELSPVLEVHAQYKATTDDLEAAREFAKEDDSFKAEIVSLEQRRDELNDQLRLLLTPADPNDGKDVILEVKAGEGGDESALFAGDLLRMYLRYAERQGWKTELIDVSEGDLGGYKDVSVAVKSKAGGVWRKLKYEGGVHRVQRVPPPRARAASTPARPAYSSCRRPRRWRSRSAPTTCASTCSGRAAPAGRASTPPTPRCGSRTCPTGTVVSCQNEKSQLQNKESAMRILRARLLVQAQEAASADANAARTSQVRTVDRSERIRTYNFAENRIADHRVGYKAYNLDAVLDGELDGVIEALIEADNAARLSAKE
jgi:peptide chain release factor 1